MNIKRFIISSVVAFVVFSALGTVFSIWGDNLFPEIQKIMRPASELHAMWPIGMVLAIVFSFLFVLIYIKGYQAKPSRVLEGMRYGFFVGLLICIAGVDSFMQFPVVANLAIFWFVTGLVQFVVTGAVVGLIYKR